MWCNLFIFKILELIDEKNWRIFKWCLQNVYIISNYIGSIESKKGDNLKLESITNKSFRSNYTQYCNSLYFNYHCFVLKSFATI